MNAAHITISRSIFNWIILLVFSILIEPVHATRPRSFTETEEVNVYLDCKTWCDVTYIKREISFVNYVVDRFDANVYLMISGRQTGAGGLEVQLVFNGQKSFGGLNDTLYFFRYATESNDDYRIKMVQMLKIGLTRYLGRTSMATTLKIQMPVDSNGRSSKPAVKELDKWDSWVFNLGASGGVSGNDYTRSSRVAASMKASRVTEKIKMSYYNYISYDKQVYYYDEDTLITENNNYSGDATVVASISDHWSMGGFGSVDKSTYNNYKISVALNPSIEYSLFSYEQSSTKSVTLFYQAGPSYREYHDSSYYGKLSETVFSQNLSLNAGVVKKWGSMWTSVGWNNYLNNFVLEGVSISGFTVHSFSLNGGIDLRVIKGLSFNMHGSAYFNKGINPNIPLASFSRDDLLTNSRVLPTNQSFYLNMGINYRFGSIFSNVVNPRFGGAGN
jgi:hypothetical protein